VAERAGFTFEAKLSRNRIGADGEPSDSLCS